MIIQKVFKVFKNFDYFIINDINCLLHNEYIEKKILNINMASKDNINKNREPIIWALLIECGYLIIDPKKEKLKIRNKAMKEFIEKQFSEWKNCLFKEYENIIDYFINNYNEKKIKKFLEDSVRKINDKNKFLDVYYNLILGLLSLNNENVVVTINKNNFNKKDNIRELLIINKNYIDAFKNISIIRNIYFIDKTKMISNFIGRDDAVYLITRPRRFGKSLNLTMFKEFFEKPINKEDERKNLFDGLEITKNKKNMREFHRYPVIFLNFKSDESDNKELAIEFLKSKIAELFKYHKGNVNFENFDDNEKNEWNKIENKEISTTDLESSVKFLMKHLYKRYNRKCIVLIDEYDKILINSMENDYYSDINKIIKSIFSQIFKGNIYLYFGIMTGCLDIGLRGFFSGCNNFGRHSLLYDPYFNDCYGFTEKELNKMISDFGIPENIKIKIKEEYDGYSCSGKNNDLIIKNLYNPYSIINFNKDNENIKNEYNFGNHWINSGSDSILKDIIYYNDFYCEQDFLRLINGNIILVKISETLSVKDNYKTLEIPNNEIWSLLSYSGYITITDDEDFLKQNISNEQELIKNDNSNTIEKNDLIIIEKDNPNSSKKILKKNIDINYLNNPITIENKYSNIVRKNNPNTVKRIDEEINKLKNEKVEKSYILKFLIKKFL